MEELKQFLNSNKDKIKITNMATQIGWSPAPLSLWLSGKIGMPKKYYEPIMEWLRNHGEEILKFTGK